MPRRNWIYAVVGLSGDAGNDMLLKIGDESAEDLPWGGYELPGRNNSERVVASKSVDPRAEPASEGRRQHGMPKSDRCGIFISAW